MNISEKLRAKKRRREGKKERQKEERKEREGHHPLEVLSDEELDRKENEIKREKDRRKTLRRLERVKKELYEVYKRDMWNIKSEIFPKITFEEYKDIIDKNLYIENWRLQFSDNEILRKILNFITWDDHTTIYNVITSYIFGNGNAVFYDDYGYPYFDV